MQASVHGQDPDAGQPPQRTHHELAATAVQVAHPLGVPVEGATGEVGREGTLGHERDRLAVLRVAQTLDEELDDDDHEDRDHEGSHVGGPEREVVADDDGSDGPEDDGADTERGSAERPVAHLEELAEHERACDEEEADGSDPLPEL